MPAASLNELMGVGSHSEDANLHRWLPFHDNAANTVVDDISSANVDGVLEGGRNTSNLATTAVAPWLTSSLGFNGTSDIVTLGTAALVGSSSNSTLHRFRTPASLSSDRYLIAGAGVTANPRWYLYLKSGLVPAWRIGSFLERTVSALSPSTNYTAAIVFDQSTGTATLYINGSAVDNVATVSYSGSDREIAIGGFDNGVGTQSNWYNSTIGETAILDRVATSGEVAEWHNGYEPINSVAPVNSGTPTEGQTLSCTTGTWGLGSPFSGGTNGTITYSYQWTRSDDGSGTGEANISGATSSTYTLQAADVGKYIRCYVAATNDGGRDVDADTPSNFTGAIAGVSTGNRRRRLLICGAA